MGGGGGERTLRKRLGTPTSRIWFVSPVIVRLINWAATYDEVFIVLVMVVAKAILFFFFSITPFYHMLFDVASINLCCKEFCCIAGIYDGAYTDRQFLNIHIHAQYITQTFYVLNLPAFYM